MPKTIRIKDLERDLRTVFDDVVRENVPYVVTQEDRPEAVLVPYEQFLRFQEQEQGLLSRFDRLRARMVERNAGFADEEIAEDVRAARRERSG